MSWTLIQEAEDRGSTACIGGAGGAPPAPALPISRAASAAARRGELDLGFPWPARRTSGRPSAGPSPSR
ncbi:hypothetical protein J3A67_002770 [Clavibacter michiganensis]|nr:hypothetical protein [Clavibacter michiganensis]MDQ0411649.1 hypothetical protein [Clavibacter michiganensis]